MAPKIYNKYWAAITVIVFLVLSIILVPMMVNKYGVAGALLRSPLLIIAAFLFYMKGYWVSTWFSGSRRKNTDQQPTPNKQLDE